MGRWRASLTLVCLLLGVGTFVVLGKAADKAVQVDKAALERARKTVQMLDDVYKNAIVLITDKYVNNADDFPAGSAAIELFSRITKKGWHDVRLLDATGMPLEAKNVAKDEFEKAGIAQLKKGESYYEDVVEKDGKAYLRAMTAVPVVLQKCTLCHPNYKTVKKNEAIGAISYTLRID